MMQLLMFGVALLASATFTRWVRDYSIAHGWTSAPGLDRHVHTLPIPRLGGVAIFLTLWCMVLLAHWLPGQFGTREFIFSHLLIKILGPATIIFLLGLADDFFGLNAYVKFAVEAGAAVLLYYNGFGISHLSLLAGHPHLGWLVGLPLTILWVLWITNAFNLIDGLDGLAAGSALFSTLVVFVVALLGGSPLVSLITLALAGAILGFLRFNFNPATIFLGDCGSLFIGFMLSALALQGAQKAPTIIAVAIPVVSFGLPILETALSVARRLISGRPVFTADREHIHHKLLQRGLSHRQVVIILYAVSAVFALLSLFLLWPTGSTLGLVLAVLGTGVWIGVQHLNYLEFGELRRVAQRTFEQRQIFVNNLAIRRATEELKVASDYQQVYRILVAAFSTNDFDGFELRSYPQTSEAANIHVAQENSRSGPALRWKKPGSHFAHEIVTAWSLTLDLVAANNRQRGSMIIYRLYTQRDLQLDINLLTSIFPVALADAIDRMMIPVVEEIPVLKSGPEFVAAQAG